MSRFESPCILVVDDDVLLRQLVSRRLESGGYKVVEAGSGDEAVTALLTGVNADALVTDISMPGSVDGWALAERSRLLNPAVPIIYMTSGAPDSTRMLKNSRFIQKPYHPDAIFYAVEEMTSDQAKRPPRLTEDPDRAT